MPVTAEGTELDAYLWGHLTKERDVHFLTLGHQASEEWLVRPFGVIDGWLVALGGKERGDSGPSLGSNPSRPQPFFPHTHKEFEVSSTDQAISSIIPGATDDQDSRGAPGHGRGGICLGNGCGTAQPSQLHKLVHAELVLVKQLLVHGLGLLLAEQTHRLSPEASGLGRGRHCVPGPARWGGPSAQAQARPEPRLP